MRINTHTRIVVHAFSSCFPIWPGWHEKEGTVACCIRGNTLLIYFGESNDHLDLLVTFHERHKHVIEDPGWHSSKTEWTGGGYFHFLDGEFFFKETSRYGTSADAGGALTPKVWEIAKRELTRLYKERGYIAD